MISENRSVPRGRNPNSIILQTRVTETLFQPKDVPPSLQEELKHLVRRDYIAKLGLDGEQVRVVEVRRADHHKASPTTNGLKLGCIASVAVDCRHPLVENPQNTKFLTRSAIRTLASEAPSKKATVAFHLPWVCRLSMSWKTLQARYLHRRS